MPGLLEMLSSSCKSQDGDESEPLSGDRETCQVDAGKGGVTKGPKVCQSQASLGDSER